MATQNSKPSDTTKSPAAQANRSPQKPPLEAAFEALQTYDTGSSRGALRPIDDAVRGAITDERRRASLEERLLTLLESKPSPVAFQYICRQLEFIGSARCVPALAAFLGDPERADAARRTLQTIPGRESLQALRNAVPKLDGNLLAEVIHTLAARAEPADTAVLEPLLRHKHAAVVEAALVALGRVGTAQAADILVRFTSKLTEPLRLPYADACLECAERLSARGWQNSVRSLLRTLEDPRFPAHVRRAAARFRGG